MIDDSIVIVESKLKRCHELLEQLFDCLVCCEDISDLRGLEYSKVFAAISFTLCSLHYVKLKVNGKNPLTHPISVELNRVKDQMQEIADLLTRDSRPTIDRGAADRIIRSLT